MGTTRRVQVVTSHIGRRRICPRNPLTLALAPKHGQPAMRSRVWPRRDQNNTHQVIPIFLHQHGKGEELNTKQVSTTQQISYFVPGVS